MKALHGMFLSIYLKNYEVIYTANLEFLYIVSKNIETDVWK